MSKTLVAYGTRYGATSEVAAEIASILQKQFNLEVDVVDLDQRFIKGKKLTEYQNIIIGSGIKVGMWTNRAKRFLKSNFEGKKIAVFVCSRRAGEVDLYDYAYSKYIEEVLNKNLKIKPIAAEAFGGRKPLKNNEYYENRNWDKIRDWAKNLGDIFSQ